MNIRKICSLFAIAVTFGFSGFDADAVHFGRMSGLDDALSYNDVLKAAADPGNPDQAAAAAEIATVAAFLPQIEKYDKANIFNRIRSAGISKEEVVFEMLHWRQDVLDGKINAGIGLGTPPDLGVKVRPYAVYKEEIENDTSFRLKRFVMDRVDRAITLLYVAKTVEGMAIDRASSGIFKRLEESDNVIDKFFGDLTADMHKASTEAGTNAYNKLIAKTNVLKIYIDRALREFKIETADTDRVFEDEYAALKEREKEIIPETSAERTPTSIGNLRGRLASGISRNIESKSSAKLALEARQKILNKLSNHFSSLMTEAALILKYLAADETRLLAFFKEVGSMIQFLHTDNQSPLSIFIDYHIYQIANEAVEVSVEGKTGADQISLRAHMQDAIFASFPADIRERKDHPTETQRNDHLIPNPKNTPWTYEELYNLYTNGGANQAGFTPKESMETTVTLPE